MARSSCRIKDKFATVTPRKFLPKLRPRVTTNKIKWLLCNKGKLNLWFDFLHHYYIIIILPSDP